MFSENLRRIPSFDSRQYGRRGATRRFSTVPCLAATMAPSARQGTLSQPDTFLGTPIAVIRRVAAAIRLSHQNARSRRILRELSDHMLEDIGLRRQDIGYGFGKTPGRLY
jgi:uncharacterized protein YjiS (DUF1127 family)